jgi:hypothetical protein
MGENLTQTPKKKNLREERVAEALRENLRKRKQQDRNQAIKNDHLCPEQKNN